MSDKKTILLVEDEALIAIAQKKTLEKHGYGVIITHSGEKAIEKVRATPGIDLILMDINLGKDKMDGTECAEIILKENDVPVLFLSSYTQSDIVEKTEKITSYGYVVKDSGETVLNASIKMAFKLHGAHRELKEGEEALKESEEKFRLLFERSVDPVLLIDGDRFVDCNEAALKILHCAGKDQLIGARPSDISPERQPDERLSSEKANEIIGDSLKLGASHFEWMHRTFDGDDFWVDVSLTVIHIQGKKMLYAVWRDITDRKQAEAEITRERVNVETRVDDIVLDARTLSPVGIIVNELLTNAVKHAFADKDSGRMAVSFSIKGGHATLIVEDNGIGIPESVNIETTTGFGLQLVTILVEQLEGSLLLKRKDGTKFVVEFEV